MNRPLIYERSKQVARMGAVKIAINIFTATPIGKRL